MDYALELKSELYILVQSDYRQSDGGQQNKFKITYLDVLNCVQPENERKCKYLTISLQNVQKWLANFHHRSIILSMCSLYSDNRRRTLLHKLASAAIDQLPKGQ